MLKIRNLLSTLPNQITAVRLVLLPILWVFAYFKIPFYIGIGTILSFITDVLDGYVARKLGQVSEAGSKFDSFADNLFLPSVLIWLWLFVPGFYAENALVCAIVITLYFTAMLLGGIKFKRFANLHLYSSKAAAVAMYVFASHALLLQRYSHLLFYLAAALFLLSSVERLVLMLSFTRVDDHMGSVLLAWRNRNLK